MATPSFPSVKNPSYNKYKEGLIKRARITEFEGNTISTRPRAGRARRKFSVGWSSLSDTENTLIHDFFKDYQGYAFNFTPPGASAPVLCVFAVDELNSTAVGPDANGRARWALGFDLYEVEDSVILANAIEEA